jgi:hypothetical protein
MPLTFGINGSDVEMFPEGDEPIPLPTVEDEHGPPIPTSGSIGGRKAAVRTPGRLGLAQSDHHSREVKLASCGPGWSDPSMSTKVFALARFVEPCPIAGFIHLEARCG